MSRSVNRVQAEWGAWVICWRVRRLGEGARKRMGAHRMVYTDGYIPIAEPRRNSVYATPSPEARSSAASQSSAERQSCIV